MSTKAKEMAAEAEAQAESTGPKTYEPLTEEDYLKKIAEIEAREAALAAKEAALIGNQQGKTQDQVREKTLAEIEAEQIAEANAYLEQYEEIKLFKDAEKYKDDVTVAVNGEVCIIKRGIPVKVKRKFILVINASEAQDNETAQLIEDLQEEYRAKQNRLT